MSGRENTADNKGAPLPLPFELCFDPDPESTTVMSGERLSMRREKQSPFELDLLDPDPLPEPDTPVSK